MHTVCCLQCLDCRCDGPAVVGRHQERRQQFVALIPIVGQVDSVFFILMLAEMQLASVVNDENELRPLRL
jgi:hypothetical protein